MNELATISSDAAPLVLISAPMPVQKPVFEFFTAQIRNANTRRGYSEHWNSNCRF